jgi:uncharacterized protein (TIGR02217 family)
MAQSGYHNVIFPEEWSQGSLYSIAYDTRIVELESGIEERVSRYNPWGRRRYTVNRGIDHTLNIKAVYEFFMLRQGSLNAFKFVDPFDNNTSSQRFFESGNPASDFAFDDVDLQFINGRNYQCVARYTDGVRVTVRPITKIDDRRKPPVFAKNGVVDGSALVDLETGIVTFSGVDTINSATGGFDYFTVVRFGDVTDKSFTIEGQATYETQSLPPIELVEVIGDTFISQDYIYGGAIDHGSISADLTISEVNGRVQKFNPSQDGLRVILPNIATTPKGGIIFILTNASTIGSRVMQVVDHNLAGVGAIEPDETRFICVMEAGSGKAWLNA